MDVLLGNSILKVCIDSAKGYCLTRLGYQLHEGIVHKASIVSMIMFYCHSVGSCVCFEGSFHFNCFVGGNSLLEVYVAETACMVDKNGVL